MNKSDKIYVAGHRGLIGSAIMRRLIRDDYANILTKTHGELDLTDQYQVRSFFEKERPEYVFLAAARVGGIFANNTYRAEFICENIMIQSNVIHYAFFNEVKKLIFFACADIYPKNCPQPAKEEYLLTGQLESTCEPFALAKIAGLKMCESYNRQYGTNFISVMPTNLYGPNDNYDLETSHVLPALIRKIHLGKCLQSGDFAGIRKDLQKYPIHNTEVTKLKDEEIINLLSQIGIKSNYPKNQKLVTRNSKHTTVIDLWGTGSPYREFLYVDDLADACIFLMQKYNAQDIGECVNIGTGEDLQIKELAMLIQKVVGYKGEIRWDTTKPDGTPKKLLDVLKINKLGWKAKIDLSAGLEKVYEEYSK